MRCRQCCVLSQWHTEHKGSSAGLDGGGGQAGGRAATHRMVLLVLKRIQGGMGRFCLAFLASFTLMRNAFWDGCSRRRCRAANHDKQQSAAPSRLHGGPLAVQRQPVQPVSPSQGRLGSPAPTAMQPGPRVLPGGRTIVARSQVPPLRGLCRLVSGLRTCNTGVMPRGKFVDSFFLYPR